MTESFPTVRPRRLRGTPAMRRLVRETRLHPAELVLPLFVREGDGDPTPIAAMPGQVQHTLESLRGAVRAAAEARIGGVMLFGVPQHRDATGTGATDLDGILNRALRVAAAEAGDALVVQSDLCLDEFTDHGHCGVLDGAGAVDNDATLLRYQQMALAQAEAGAGLLGLSGMMDGQVAAVRSALDAAGRSGRPAARLRRQVRLGLLRPVPRGRRLDAHRGPPDLPARPGERPRGPCARRRLDVAEGADIVMVKPAGPYLDVLAEVAATSPVPVWAYQVSGEYSMIEAAAERGWIDRRRAVEESVLGIRRAGADAVLTYWATELAGWLGEDR